jgi:PhnB protein
MSAQPFVNTYLFFGGNCEEALDYYAQTLGAEVGPKMRFNESPDPIPAGVLAPGFENKIMHSELKLGGTSIFASDGISGESKFGGFSVSLGYGDQAEAERVFQALAADGTIGMPWGPTFFSPLFGSVTDKFGMDWMISYGMEP